ncbi:hypothetical protein [Butyrivibrio sp. VCB2001]|uniref:hypothetical protein n=1 Tax=Butyrivibrio sp. VCB2001 TaxID=1280667 RepID=UPI000425C449|nr:hypothetical protein [Butyrivibrio sp. VCB2001]
MTGINITSLDRQVKDIGQEIYAAKQQRDEKLAKSSPENKDGGLQMAIHEKLSDRSNVAFGDTAATLSISALGAEELEKVRDSWNNHPVSSLYRTEIPINKNAEGAYKIGGVSFSEEEFDAARKLVTGVGSQLKAGYLSYRDYAKMKVAQKVVENTAAAGFNEDQAKVISKAMRDYNNGLVERQSEMLSGRTTRVNDDPESGRYFGVEVLVPGSVTESGTPRYASTDIATDRELIKTLRDSIRAVDITGKNAASEIKALYQDIMKPVYAAQYPFQRESDINDALDKDVKELMALIDVEK